MARARIADAVGLSALAAATAGSGAEAAGPRAAGTALGAACSRAGLAGSGAAGADIAARDAAAPAPGAAVPRETLATAVRYSLQLLAERAKGNTVEVRVPPFAAVQCIEGPGHTRGTPPNVVEMDAPTWLSLATGTLDWVSGVEAGRIHASGQRADLRGYVPLAGLASPPGTG
jgi:hypothetical protein